MCNLELWGKWRKMKCLSCKTNYVSQEFDKLVYLKLVRRNCLYSCEDTNIFLTKKLDYVSSCQSGTYEYPPNNTCVDDNPNIFILNEENTKFIFTSFNNETSPSDCREVIFKIY